MPRKITHPYTRETSLTDHEGKTVVISLTPPGAGINFRPKHGRESYYLSMERAYEVAQQETAKAPVRAKARPDLQPMHPQELKRMRIQKNLGDAIEKLVGLVQKQVV